MPNSRLVTTVLIPGAGFAFFFGTWLSARRYYSGRVFDLNDAVLSRLQSPADNPRGYLYGAVGAVLCGVLLLPAARMFHVRLRAVHGGLAAFGASTFAAGLLASVAIGCLAPFAEMFDPVHIYLAFAAFLGMLAGILTCTALAARAAWQSRRRGLTGALSVVLALQATMLIYLGCALVTEKFFTGESWLTNLALSEWVLSGSLIVYTGILAFATGRAAESFNPPEICG